MPDHVIVAEGLTYRYGDLTADDQIDFSLQRGEIFGFLGPNGAGKSTTVKMLTGQLKPHAGKAIVLDRDVARHPKQIQARIGVCFEVTNLYEQMCAAANLSLWARLFGVAVFDNAQVRHAFAVTPNKLAFAK